jgi:hypothetical protein
VWFCCAKLYHTCANTQQPLAKALCEKELFMTDYIDDYQSCQDTYATLLIYTGEKNPEEISIALDLIPTRISHAYGRHLNGWFLSSKEHIDSKDCRRHIDWILDKISDKKDILLNLQNNNIKISIMCMWASQSGNGGPTISPKQMSRLVDLNLEVSWDVWC